MREAMILMEGVGEMGGGAGGLAVLSRLLRRLRTDLEPERLKRAKNGSVQAVSKGQ